MGSLSHYVPECCPSSWQNLSSHLKWNNLSFLCLNIRSLTGKFQKSVSHLNEVKEKFTFIIITENWLKKNPDFVFEIEGYKSLSSYRENQIGGGIKIYFVESISVCIITNLSSSTGSCESLFIKTSVPGVGCITVGSVYRPPGKPIGEFNQFMDETLESLYDSPAVVLGDFNLNTLS